MPLCARRSASAGRLAHRSGSPTWRGEPVWCCVQASAGRSPSLFRYYCTCHRNSGGRRLNIGLPETASPTLEHFACRGRGNVIMSNLSRILNARSPFGFDRAYLGFCGWRVLDNEEERGLLERGILSRYGRNYMPLFRRDDSDEVLCLSPSPNETAMGKVFWIEDYSDRGWEVIEEFDSVDDWYSSLKPEV